MTTEHKNVIFQRARGAVLGVRFQGNVFTLTF